MNKIGQEQDAADKLEQNQDEAIDKLEQNQDEAADKIGREQKEAADKLEQNQDEAADKLERGQDEAADKIGREQKEAEDKLEHGYLESHDKFKREVKESMEHLKKDHKITQDTLKTRHAETRELLKKTMDLNTLESRNIQTEKEIVSHHKNEVNTLQRDYQSSIDRLDAENNEALSRHKQTQANITEKLKQEQDAAADKIGREQKEAADKIGREQKESREKLSFTQLETKNRLGRLKDAEIRTILKKRTLIVVSMAILVAGTGFASYLTYVDEFAGQRYQVSNLGKMPTGYTIQDLKGDTIDTWLSWRLVSGSTLHVGIMNAVKYPEKIPLIKEVILSEEAIYVDDSLLHKGPKGTTSKYYIGWQGALEQASTKSTELYIPTKLDVIESARGEGEITIILTDEKNGDGYAGYTKSIADRSQNQILKSTITIYDASNISDEQFRTILRHEFGHTLGLAHSTAPEELMAPTIQTSYPYISECDIDTIVKLYDGGKNSQVICGK